MESVFYGLNNENMTKEELEVLTKEAVMVELSQNYLDGRELLDFDEVMNVVKAVVKNCSIPDVVAPSGDVCPKCGGRMAYNGIRKHCMAIYCSYGE